MSFSGKSKHILTELRVHAPFTLLGAATGIAFMLLGKLFLDGHEKTLFAIFHPLHVVLSAMVTASLFEIHRKASNFLLILIVGIIGSIGVATLSDSILPFFGEEILGVSVLTHDDLHHHDEHAAHGESCEHHDHSGHPKLHLGFIEEWYLVFPAAIIGVVLAYFFPKSKYPHASHVLVSTWASSSHILMNTQTDLTLTLLGGMFVVLFIAVWLPCCVSDIIFPLLWVRPDGGAHLGHSCILCFKKDKKDEKQSH